MTLNPRYRVKKPHLQWINLKQNAKYKIFQKQYFIQVQHFSSPYRQGPYLIHLMNGVHSVLLLLQ